MHSSRYSSYAQPRVVPSAGALSDQLISVGGMAVKPVTCGEGVLVACLEGPRRLAVRRATTGALSHEPGRGRCGTRVDDATVEGYWGSWAGRWQRWRTRGVRTVHLLIPGEPVKKGDRRAGRREAEIREQVARELRGVKRSMLTGPVALSLHLRTARSEPPDLPKLAKYLLDVLGSQKVARGSGPALYRDDRHVKMLHVSWSRTVNGTNSASTRILARPLRDVMEDLCLGYEVELATHAADDGRGPFAFEKLREEDPAIDDYGLPADVQEMLFRHDRRRSQDVLLERTGACLRCLLSSAPERVSGARPRPRRKDLEPVLQDVWAQLEKGYDKSWTALFSQPLTVSMPSLPARAGEEAIFRASLDAQLAEFAGRWPSMVPLEAPLNVTILVVPPEQGKDLDNLALAILPVLRRVFRPEMPNELAVTSYQVIDLARRPSDPPAGYLRVVLGTESRYQSDWDRIAGYVDEHAGEEFN